MEFYLSTGQEGKKQWKQGLKPLNLQAKINLSSI